MQEEGIFQKNIKPNPSVVFTDLEDGSAVLLDLDSKFYYSLNGGTESESTGMLRNLPKGKNEMIVKAFDKLGNSTLLELSFTIE